jgi:hypothetical protein
MMALPIRIAAKLALDAAYVLACSRWGPASLRGRKCLRAVPLLVAIGLAQESVGRLPWPHSDLALLVSIVLAFLGWLVWMHRLERAPEPPASSRPVRLLAEMPPHTPDDDVK